MGIQASNTGPVPDPQWPFTGGSNFAPLRTNPDSLSEFRVITSNPSAEYGRSSGTTVQAVTRSDLAL